LFIRISPFLKKLFSLRTPFLSYKNYCLHRSEKFASDIQEKGGRNLWNAAKRKISKSVLVLMIPAIKRGFAANA